MKKFGFFLLFLFFSVGFLYAFLQSAWLRNRVQQTIVEEMQKNSFQVEIGRIEGTLPHLLKLKRIRLQKEDLVVNVEEISLRLILWRLLKKEIAFKDIHAKQIAIKDVLPFDFQGKGGIDERRAFLQGNIDSWQIHLRYRMEKKVGFYRLFHPLLQIKGEAFFSNDLSLKKTNLHLFSQKLLPSLTPSLQGNLSLEAHVEKKENGYVFSANWHLFQLALKNLQMGSLNGKAQGVYEENQWKATAFIERLAELQCSFSFGPSFLLRGHCDLEIQSLQSPLLSSLYGSLSLKSLWDHDGMTQRVHLEGNAKECYYKNAYAKTLLFSSELFDPFHHLQGKALLELEKGTYQEWLFEKIAFQSDLQKEKGAYRILAEGAHRHPFSLQAEGSWEKGKKVELSSLGGTLLSHPVSLAHPASFLFVADRQFSLPDLEFSIGQGSVFFDFSRKEEKIDLALNCEDLPLDLLALHPLELEVKGGLSFHALFSQKGSSTEGSFDAFFSQTSPLPLTGQVSGALHRNLLQFQSTFQTNRAPFLQLEAKLPLHLSFLPLQAYFSTHKNCKLDLDVDGRVEELLDFFDLGPHRLEGKLLGSLHLRNTLARPLVEGTFSFQEGLYENYLSGTLLKHLHADFLAEKNTLFLRSLTAEDSLGNKNLFAQGNLHLRLSELYPFFLEVKMDNFRSAQIDLVEANLSGTLHIKGNAVKALAEGSLEVDECQITIPDHIPHLPPHLDVTYIHPVHPVSPPPSSSLSYPLHLNLFLKAPGQIEIGGRGLSSEWKGEFHLGGTNLNPSIKGKLELIEGQFQFATRIFKLTEGSFSLSGMANEMPILHLSAVTETKGVHITAHLHGPLDDPQLSLESSPPLPLGSIMSYLLFGQDISEIGGFQALEIATALASFAGTGGDVLENTRRSLGVDRLRVVADPGSGEEGLALQVGKYIAKGVLVTLTQGTDESSTNISVEIELKDNLIFQIESDQAQEQGKFTLKWHLNY